MAGIEALTGALRGAGSVGAGSGADLSALFEAYQAQITGNPTGAQATAAAARGADFAQQIGAGLQQVQALDQVASDKAIQAATGDLTDVQDYVIAATQAQLATNLTTTIRNKALESFNEIMRMPL